LKSVPTFTKVWFLRFCVNISVFCSLSVINPDIWDWFLVNSTFSLTFCESVNCKLPLISVILLVVTDKISAVLLIVFWVSFCNNWDFWVDSS
jgi:hypothetical protein